MAKIIVRPTSPALLGDVNSVTVLDTGFITTAAIGPNRLYATEMQQNIDQGTAIAQVKAFAYVQSGDIILAPYDYYVPRFPQFLLQFGGGGEALWQANEEMPSMDIGRRLLSSVPMTTGSHGLWNWDDINRLSKFGLEVGYGNMLSSEFTRWLLEDVWLEVETGATIETTFTREQMPPCTPYTVVPL